MDSNIRVRLDHIGAEKVPQMGAWVGGGWAEVRMPCTQTVVLQPTDERWFRQAADIQCERCNAVCRVGTFPIGLYILRLLLFGAMWMAFVFCVEHVHALGMDYISNNPLWLFLVLIIFATAIAMTRFYTRSMYIKGDGGEYRHRAVRIN